MKYIITLAILSLSLSGYAQNDKKEIETIKKVITTAYQDGLLNEGDVKKIDEGFHPDFQMLGVLNGEMFRYSISDWKAANEKKLQEGTLPKKDKDKVTIKIPMVDIAGTAAVAKIEFFVDGKMKFIDYQSLIKFEDGWKIVAKIYTTVGK